MAVRPKPRRRQLGVCVFPGRAARMMSQSSRTLSLVSVMSGQEALTPTGTRGHRHIIRSTLPIWPGNSSPACERQIVLRQIFPNRTGCHPQRTPIRVDPSAPDPVTPRWQFAVGSGILGWVLDAFDFFVVIFLFDTLAARFHVSKADIVYTLTLTLAMRPVGALFFGTLADRFGRKRPLIFCVLFFSTSHHPQWIRAYLHFLPGDARTLWHRYGRVLGHWRVVRHGECASTMARHPLRRDAEWISSWISSRGCCHATHRARFWMALDVRRRLSRDGADRSVHNSCARIGALEVAPSAVATQNLRHSVEPHRHLCLSSAGHVCHDLPLPWYLGPVSGFSQVDSWARAATNPRHECHVRPARDLQHWAILGALFFGHISETIGRRRSIILALGVSLLSIPAWVFGSSLLALVLGSYFMQTGVQGAFGVIPAHLNELSPDAVRSLFPGFVYQLGVLIGSPAVSFEYALRNRPGYPWALTSFEACVILALCCIFTFGPERLGRNFRVAE